MKNFPPNILHHDGISYPHLFGSGETPTTGHRERNLVGSGLIFRGFWTFRDLEVTTEDETCTFGRCNSIMAGQPTPPNVPISSRNIGWICGLIKGNQWLINPDHKALFLGGYLREGGRLIFLLIHVLKIPCASNCHHLEVSLFNFFSSWCEKYAQVKLDRPPKDRDEKKQVFETST